MKLLVLLLVLVIQRSFGSTPVNQPDHWFDRFCAWVNERIPGPAEASRLAVTVVIPAIVLWSLLRWLDNWLIIFVVDVTVLIYAVGVGRIRDSLTEFLVVWRTVTEHSDQSAKALEKANAIAVDQLGAEPMDHPTPGVLVQSVQEGIILSTFNRFFVTLFWYMVFGAAGALLVRLTDRQVEQLGDPETPHLSRNLQSTIRWLPVRVHAIALALVGDFVRTFNQLMRDLVDFTHANRFQMLNYAYLAQGSSLEQERSKDWSGEEFSAVEEQLQSVLQLVERGRLVWFIGVALIVIIGW